MSSKVRGMVALTHGCLVSGIGFLNSQSLTLMPFLRFCRFHFVNIQSSRFHVLPKRARRASRALSAARVPPGLLLPRPLLRLAASLSASLAFHASPGWIPQRLSHDREAVGSNIFFIAVLPSTQRQEYPPVPHSPHVSGKKTGGLLTKSPLSTEQPTGFVSAKRVYPSRGMSSGKTMPSSCAIAWAANRQVSTLRIVIIPSFSHVPLVTALKSEPSWQVQQ
mmetsp:Transcript_18040/g.38553  ORF Transcript_18040/g.38553 Transcript_18040/m.38553 type:complete len:221 (+) Transcript_18040:1215-1877(+)